MTMTKNILAMAALLVTPLTRLHATDLVFQNFGTLTNVPQVDATTFINSGSFSVFTVLPFDTQNTLHFSNLGIMSGNPGFRFDYVTPDGVRRPAADFFNGIDGRVTASSGATFLPGVAGGGAGAGIAFENAQIIINATNITSHGGQISADARGLVRLQGSKIDVSRSAVGIFPFTGGFGFTTETNFFPDVGVTDIYWGMNNDGTPNMQLPSLVRPVRNSTNSVVNSPQHRVTNSFRFNGFNPLLSLTNASAFILTNAVTLTNRIIQAVFVQQATNNEFAIDVRFAPSTITTNPYTTAVVQFSNPETNVLQAGNFLTEIYLIDRVASETNFLLLTNLTTRNTYRPSNYEVTRLTPPEFLTGRKGNANATNAATLIFNPGYTNTLVTNLYSGYAFNVTNVAAVVPDVPGASLTNLPGRIEIQADQAILDRTRIRGEGIVSISARTLTSSNAVVDVQNMNLDLGAPNEPLLIIKNLVKEELERTSGNFLCWSGMWTNQTGFLTTNSIPDPNNPGGMTNEVVTNVVDVGFHVLVVDATPVVTRQPVFVANFTAHSKHLEIHDTLRVTERLLVEAQSMHIRTNVVVSSGLVVTNNATNVVFTTNIVSGKLLLTNTIPDWNRGNFPNLRSLINDGAIYLVGSGDFGTGGRSPSYDLTVNRGRITAFNAAFRSLLFENRGSVQVNSGPFGAGTITLDSGSAILENGNFVAGGPIRITTGDLRMRNYTNRTSQAFTLVVTNSVTEGGTGASNLVSSEGFHLLRKPLTGDLLGTIFQSTAPNFLEIPHTWAGIDRGATAEGYRNNMAIGRLVLKGGIDTLHSFRGISTNNALYVDFLEFQGMTLADVPNMIQIDPNFRVYFAASNLAADQLNGLLGGRLRWVSGFAGLSSSVEVVLKSSNQTIQMNRSLRESMTIDTDGDGIVNGLDPNPRDDLDRVGRTALSYVAVNTAPPAISFSWQAAPGVVYKVEYTTDIQSADWKHLTTYTNTSSSARTATVQDQVADQKQRYYRIRAD